MTPELPRILETPRLVLEAISPKHARGIWRAIEASLPELRRWLVWALDTSPEVTRQWARGASRLWKERTDWVFVILQDGAPAGSVGIHRHDPVHNQAVIGYWLRSDLAGKGFMTEATSVAVEFAFDKVKLHRLELRAATGNGASIKVAEKLGFKREGVARQATRTSEGYEDAFIFGLITTDPRPRFHTA